MQSVDDTYCWHWLFSSKSERKDSRTNLRSCAFSASVLPSRKYAIFQNEYKASTKMCVSSSPKSTLRSRIADSLNCCSLNAVV